MTRWAYAHAKRWLDVSLSLMALVILSPLLAGLALCVLAAMGRPVLFVQRRPGKGEKPFWLLKFRTMTETRAASGHPLPDRDRLTRFGAFLRRTSLDELPTLFNVLRGEMSLVGPRPLLERYTPYFTERERLRLTVMPGITGWAQVNGRNNSPWDVRLERDAWYVENRSFKLDIRILLMTLGKVLNAEDVVVDARSVMQNLDEERSRGDERGEGSG